MADLSKNDWNDYLTDKNGGYSITDINGNRVYMANPTHEAWDALEVTLEANGYQINRVDGYNPRKIRGSTDIWSSHSYGAAVDINPKISDPRYGDPEIPQFIGHFIESIKTNNGVRVFEWGGFWQGKSYDSPHIEMNARPEDLETGIDWESVNGSPQYAPRCFPAFTLISTAKGNRLISELRVGDKVWAFDAGKDNGRGDLVLKRIKRLYRNTTPQWIKLSWVEDGQQKELVSTPGHHFLDAYGQFPPIDEMVQQGKATIVLASGAVAEATAKRIVYSAGTAHLFEAAQAQALVSGNLALKPKAVFGWQTYNFEVGDFHTYIAGGVRVHNQSGPVGQLGSTLDSGLDRLASMTTLGGNYAIKV